MFVNDRKLGVFEFRLIVREFGHFMSVDSRAENISNSRKRLFAWISQHKHFSHRSRQMNHSQVNCSQFPRKIPQSCEIFPSQVSRLHFAKGRRDFSLNASAVDSVSNPTLSAINWSIDDVNTQREP